MKTHRLGDRGNDIGVFQTRLKRAGYTVDVTNAFDAATEAAVMALQTKTGLVVDGIAGPKTYSALMTGRRDPKHLADADLVRAAETLDVPLACVRAVNEVESHGSGYLLDGRPVILFESHVFYRRLKAIGIDPDPLVLKSPNIVYPTYGGYSGGAAEYTRLASAELIDPTAAYESASWGAFQVMGENWKRLGYSSIVDFVSRMENSEADQLDAFVRYVAADSTACSGAEGPEVGGLCQELQRAGFRAQPVRREARPRV